MTADNFYHPRMWGVWIPKIKPEYEHLSSNQLIRLEKDGVDIRAPAELNTRHISKLLQEASTDAYAFDLLKKVAVQVIRKRIEMPPDFAEWLTELIAGSRSRPRLRGKHRFANIWRDMEICVEVERTRTGDLPATRNAASEPVSACDLVADRRGMSYEAVAKIWSRRIP